jgi:chromosome segregation ATPase
VNDQEQNTQSAPSGTLENEGTGDTPAGGTAKPLDVVAKTDSNPAASVDSAAAEPVTLAQHVDAKVAAIDNQLAQMDEQKTALTEEVKTAPAAVSAVKTSQIKTLDSAMTELQKIKQSLLAALESIPAELHQIEAGLLAALKHLF